MEQYLVGSKLIGLKNCRDTDYLIVYEGEMPKVERIQGVECFYTTKEFLGKTLRFEKESIIMKNRSMFNYQLDTEIIGQNFPIEYHILNYRKELIKYLQKVVMFKKYKFDKEKYNKNNCCDKKIYHIAYNMFILQNNSPILTNEQKEIVQKIHDKEMPVEYLDEMEKIIKSFKIESE